MEKFFDCEIYRYKLSNLETNATYSFTSTKILPEEAIQILKDTFVVPGFNYTIHCNKELIYKIKKYDSTKSNGTKDGEHASQVLPAR